MCLLGAVEAAVGRAARAPVCWISPTTGHSRSQSLFGGEGFPSAAGGGGSFCFVAGGFGKGFWRSLFGSGLGGGSCASTLAPQPAPPSPPPPNPGEQRRATPQYRPKPPAKPRPQPPNLTFSPIPPNEPQKAPSPTLIPPPTRLRPNTKNPTFLPFVWSFFGGRPPFGGASGPAQGWSAGLRAVPPMSVGVAFFGLFLLGPGWFSGGFVKPPCIWGFGWGELRPMPPAAPTPPAPAGNVTKPPQNGRSDHGASPPNRPPDPTLQVHDSPFGSDHRTKPTQTTETPRSPQ